MLKYFGISLIFLLTGCKAHDTAVVIDWTKVYHLMMEKEDD